MVEQGLPYEMLVKALVKLAQTWKTLRAQRGQELEAISAVCGEQEPERLAQWYIQPDCQIENPANLDEDDLADRHRSPMWRYLATFLGKESLTRDGRNQLFVLSDAGMGKTSLLVMLKLAHLNKFWPGGPDFVLRKIGAETLVEVSTMGPAGNTVLLLDSLDEYRGAWGKVPQYLAELLQATKLFRRVIITCRTQFFPPVVHSVLLPELVVVGGFQCPLEYLSAFDDAQVEAFLEKVYPNSLGRRALQWLRLMRQDNKQLRIARRLKKPMSTLRCRPMLLSYIRELVAAQEKQPWRKRWDEFAVYEALVEQWLLREKRKNPDLDVTKLLAACKTIAIELCRKGKRELTLAELNGLKARCGVVQTVEDTELKGRSLLNTNSQGDYRFSHYTFQEYLAVAGALEAEGASRAGLADILVTDQMLRFARAWIDGVPLSPSSWGDGPVDMTLAELADQAEVLRRGLLLRTRAKGAAGTGENGTPESLPQPRSVPRLEPLGRKALDAVDLTSAKLEKADLRGAELSGVVLCHARLAGAQLTHANLADADLSDADLRGADLTDADLTRARLTGATHDTSTKFPADLDMMRLSVSGYELVWIPAGTFTMGSPESEPGRSSDESPQHTMELEGFWLGKYPVTNEEYARFLKANPKAKKPEYWDNPEYNSPRLPVVGVSWDEVQEYCKWAGLVLPTEVQWEYACRAGTTTRYWSGDSEADLARVGWYDGNSGGKLHPVGEKEPNPFGLYDMHGNVWEWCQDRYGSYEEGVRPGDGLRSSRSASLRVRRGGSWGARAGNCRSGVRGCCRPCIRVQGIGFRHARVIT